MKKMFAAVTTLMLIIVSATMAEKIPFTEWLEQQTAVAEQPVVQDEPLVAEGTPLIADPEVKAPSSEVASSEATEEFLPEFAPIGMGSRGIYVEKLQEKLNQLGIPAGKVDGRFGPMTEAALKTVQNALGWEETGVVETEEEWNEIMGIERGDGVNLAVGTSDEWTEWLKPEYNEKNQCFIISTAYLEEKEVGDPFTCQIEIGFSDVTTTGNEDQPFRFFAQGKADDNWENWTQRNVWNFSLINLTNAPENGVVRYVSTQQTTELGVDVKQWDLGFRCDYWASGKFRVRCVKVEKGVVATEWAHSPKDIGDGINLAVGTSNEWSEWMSPKYNEKNQCFIVSTAYLGEKEVGDPYTCQIEIEFSDVTTTGNEDQLFRFFTQGKADGDWENWTQRNAWNFSLINLTNAPENGVIRYVSTQQTTELGVDVKQWDLGFRCDYWASGQFRVRCVKVEKGMTATVWSPAP